MHCRPAAWTSTTVSSTGCSSATSSRSPRCSTGTCPARWRRRVAGPSATPHCASPTTRQAMAERYADRVDRWATLNEPWCSAFLGYCAGYFAPGRREPGASLAAAYHLILGHGMAVERLRAADARNVGIVLNLIPIISETPSMDAVTQHIDGLQNRIFLDLLAGNGIPADLLESCASVTDWGFVRPEDNPTLSAPIDWLGENYYTVMRVAAPDSGRRRRHRPGRGRHPGVPADALRPPPPVHGHGLGDPARGHRDGPAHRDRHPSRRAPVDLRERGSGRRGDGRDGHPRPDPHGLHR